MLDYGTAIASQTRKEARDNRPPPAPRAQTDGRAPISTTNNGQLQPWQLDRANNPNATKGPTGQSSRGAEAPSYYSDQIASQRAAGAALYTGSDFNKMAFEEFSANNSSASTFMEDVFDLRDQQNQVRAGQIDDAKIEAGIDFEDDRKEVATDARLKRQENRLNKEIAALELSVNQGNLGDIPKLRALAARRLATAEKGSKHDTKQARRQKKRDFFAAEVAAGEKGMFHSAGRREGEEGVRGDFRETLTNIALGREEDKTAYDEKMQGIATQERNAQGGVSVAQKAMEKFGINRKQINHNAKVLGRQIGKSEKEMMDLLDADYDSLPEESQKLVDQVIGEMQIFGDGNLEGFMGLVDSGVATPEDYDMTTAWKNKNERDSRAIQEKQATKDSQSRRYSKYMAENYTGSGMGRRR